MLKESEVYYLKTLLKKDTEKWEFKSNLADIYRHGKFTIRMLTRKMARIDSGQDMSRAHAFTKFSWRYVPWTKVKVKAWLASHWGAWMQDPPEWFTETWRREVGENCSEHVSRGCAYPAEGRTGGKSAVEASSAMFQ